MESWDEILLSAARRGLNNTVEDCLSNGAQVNCKDWLGRTPLHRAAVRGHTETVNMLISKGAIIESMDNEGWTPLHWASFNCHTNTVAMLISKGAVTDSKDNDGSTALHWAARRGNRGIVDILISMGAAVDGKDNDERTPYDVADNDQIKQLIQSKEGLQKIKKEKSQRRDPSVMLNRLLGEGSFESYDMRVMVTGQFGVGKTSLVMILVGENIPNMRHSTDGISLLEGRCGLGIEERDWILIDKNDYNASDVVYDRVLMSSEESRVDNKVTPTQRHQQPSISHSSKENITYVDKAIQRDVHFGSLPKKQDQPLKCSLIKPKMTKGEIRKKMDQVLKKGKYKMKIGRLIFWDFGGQYVYYTTHQTFMTYRALFLVVFDGSKNLHEEVHDVVCFPGQHGTPTAAVFLQHWVNSILTYCTEIHPGIPQILFIATHKDKVPKALVEEQRNTLYNEIEDLFRYQEGLHNLVLKHRLFVNATDINDPEIHTVKQIITDLTFNHPCWGERMPNMWIPLELEIAELAAEGKQILLLKQVKDLNKSSEISVLSEKDLKFFLQFQHSLGKIVYFDTPQLREFVIISPLFLVEVMKSFVTDKQFWPKGRKQKTYKKMSRCGIIEKNDLFAIWERPEFAKILPYKEFVFDILVHLDILSEQRRYDVTTGRRLNVEKYFVPCMLTRINTTRYMEKECIPSRAIGLAFVFKGNVIPPALPNRLISACLSIWFVKEYEGEIMLFSGFVVLSCDKSHDIVVCVQRNKILVYIIHKSSKGLICSDTATGVRECMHTTVQRIFEFYQSTSSVKNSDENLPFHVELACSKLKCYLTEDASVQNRNKLCPDHRTKYEIDVWYQDECSDQCDVSCEGLSQDALYKTPTYSEIFRLSSTLDAVKVYELAVHLGVKVKDWNDLKSEYPHDISMVKFLVLRKWRDTMNGTFGNIAKPLKQIGESLHVLCQVRRIKKKPPGNDIPVEYLDCIPTDEILDALAPEIGKVSFMLGIELGRSVPELENIQSDYKNDSVTQTKKILYNWRNDMSVKATLGVLQQALVNVERGTMCLRKIVDDLGVNKIELQRNEIRTNMCIII